MLFYGDRHKSFRSPTGLALRRPTAYNNNNNRERRVYLGTGDILTCPIVPVLIPSTNFLCCNTWLTTRSSSSIFVFCLFRLSTNCTFDLNSLYRGSSCGVEAEKSRVCKCCVDAFSRLSGKYLPVVSNPGRGVASPMMVFRGRLNSYILSANFPCDFFSPVYISDKNLASWAVNVLCPLLNLFIDLSPTTIGAPSSPDISQQIDKWMRGS